MHQSVKKLLHKVVVSCQAYEDTPLYGPENMKRMAESAVMGGCGGIRACWAQDIKAIRSVTGLPIIGINKVLLPGVDPLKQIYITPTLESAAPIIEAGADILGLDCTVRDARGLDALCALLRSIRERYPDTAILADCDSVENAVVAAGTGLVDVVSTTLVGYTPASLHALSDGPDLAMVRALKQQIALPVNCEGRIWEREQLEEAWAAGADFVTIGSAVTRPQLITARFVECTNDYFAAAEK